MAVPRKPTKNVSSEAKGAPEAPNQPSSAENAQADSSTVPSKDTEEKTWMDRNTPFGVVRVPERAPGIDESIGVADGGDQLRFESTSPFGSHSWTRSKAELTELEQMVWDKELAKGGSKPVQ
jgi:hypothetical protein